MTTISEERRMVLCNKIKRALKSGPKTTRNIAAQIRETNITDLDAIMFKMEKAKELARDPIPKEEQPFFGKARFIWRLP